METTIRSNGMSRGLCFLQIMARHKDCAFVTVSNPKKLPLKISPTLLQILLKIDDHFGRTIAVSRYTVAGQIGDTVISLL